MSVNIILTFMVAFLVSVKIPILALDIRASEIILLLLFFLNFHKIVLTFKSGLGARVLSILLLYVLTQLFIDFYRGVSVLDSIRGIARLIVLLISFIVFTALIKFKKWTFESYCFGVFLSLLILPFTNEYGAEFNERTFKLVYSEPIIIGILLFFSLIFSKSKQLVIVAVLILSGFGFFMNFRSLGGELFLVSFNIFFKSTKFINITNNSKSLKKVGLSFIVLTVVCFLFYQFYNWAAPKGILGVSVMEKYNYQYELSGGNTGLLSGRSESLYSIPKILESPFLGWGANAKDPMYMYYLKLQLDPRFDGDLIDGGVIPTHSHVLGAWLEGGIIGAMFWIAIVLIVLKNVIISDLKTLGSFYSVILFVSILLIWDIFFSPFAGSRRIWVGIVAGLNINIAERLGYTKVLQFIPVNAIKGKLASSGIQNGKK